jgi:hypothetical protein
MPPIPRGVILEQFCGFTNSGMCNLGNRVADPPTDVTALQRDAISR